MAEENKAPENQETPKSAEQVVAELKAENELLNKRVKDKEEMIGKQSTEIGELRKKSEPPPKAEPQNDELVEEIYRDLKADGLDDDTARYNAKILARSGRKTFVGELDRRMMSEVVDLVEEAMEEKKIDESIYKDNETEILSEVRARKLAPTARKNYKILRDCYDIVTRRKADALRAQKETEDAGKRDGLIAASNQPAGGGHKSAPADDKQATDSIRNAGTKRENAFF